MAFITTEYKTTGENFYNITSLIKSTLKHHLDAFDSKKQRTSGLLCIFIPHTSCALTISEAFDRNATSDVENFLKHLAGRNLPFITHTTEGTDDSPSHMKSILLQQSMNLIVENGEILLGTWQGIFLAEFRDDPKVRNIHLKFMPDS